MDQRRCTNVNCDRGACSCSDITSTIKCRISSTRIIVEGCIIVTTAGESQRMRTDLNSVGCCQSVSANRKDKIAVRWRVNCSRHIEFFQICLTTTVGSLICGGILEHESINGNSAVDLIVEKVVDCLEGQVHCLIDSSQRFCILANQTVSNGCSISIKILLSEFDDVVVTTLRNVFCKSIDHQTDITTTLDLTRRICAERFIGKINQCAIQQSFINHFIESCDCCLDIRAVISVIIGLVSTISAIRIIR